MDLRRPLMICGMPRSGTTLIGQVMKTGDRDSDGSVSDTKEHVRIYPELDPGKVAEQFALLGSLGKLLTSTTWRNFTEELISERKLELLRAIWRSGRPDRGAPDEGHERFGLKQPNGELFYRRYRKALGEYSPIYIYCVRTPDDVYRSNLNTMGKWGDIGPSGFRRKYKKSLSAVAKMEPSDVAVVDIDRLTADEATRRKAIQALFTFCDVEYTDRTERFVTDWPAVNRGSREGIESMSGAEVDRRVQRFRSRAGNLVSHIDTIRTSLSIEAQ